MQQQRHKLAIVLYNFLIFNWDHPSSKHVKNRKWTKAEKYNCWSMLREEIQIATIQKKTKLRANSARSVNKKKGSTYVSEQQPELH